MSIPDWEYSWLRCDSPRCRGLPGAAAPQGAAREGTGAPASVGRCRNAGRPRQCPRSVAPSAGRCQPHPSPAPLPRQARLPLQGPTPVPGPGSRSRAWLPAPAARPRSRRHFGAATKWLPGSPGRPRGLAGPAGRRHPCGPRRVAPDGLSPPPLPLGSRSAGRQRKDRAG